jgi:Ca2+-binding EF-hand superfamily protein
MRFDELKRIFDVLDINRDGSITHAEFLRGLKKNDWIAKKLGNIVCSFRRFFIFKFVRAGLPADVRQEDGSRDSYQLAFGQMDNDDSKTIECVFRIAFFHEKLVPRRFLLELD